MSIKWEASWGKGRFAACLAVLLAGSGVILAAGIAKPKPGGEPKAVERTVDEAVAALANKDFAKAASLLEEAAKKHTDNKEVHYWLGMAYREQSQWDKAIESLRKASDLAPNDVDLIKLIAQTYAQKNDSVQALRWYEKALALKSDDPDLKDKMAKLRDRVQNGPGAPPKVEPPKPQGGGFKLDEIDWAEFARVGVAGKVPEDQKNLAHGAGAAAVLVFPALVFALLRARYRSPVTAQQRWFMAKACTVVIVLTYLVVWGYQPHWRMAAAGLFALGVLLGGRTSEPRPSGGGGGGGGGGGNRGSGAAPAGPAAKRRQAEIFMNFLKQQGYSPYIDEDGDVVFRHEGGSYVVIIDPSDEVFFRLVYPNFWRLSSESERRKAVRAAVTATGKIKVAKIYVLPDGKNVWASVEIFHGSTERFLSVFRRSLGAIRSAVNSFRETMQTDA